MSLAPTPLPIEDYDAIQAAVMETGRGRWFLSEYARRNRQADTEVVLDAIDRIARMAGSPAERDIELADLAKFVQDARRAVTHVHATTGSAPIDYVIDTMLTIEQRLDSLGGKTRAAAKLVAIAETKPADVEDIEPDIVREAASLEETGHYETVSAESVHPAEIQDDPVAPVEDAETVYAPHDITSFNAAEPSADAEQLSEENSAGRAEAGVEAAAEAGQADTAVEYVVVSTANDSAAASQAAESKIEDVALSPDTTGSIAIEASGNEAVETLSAVEEDDTEAVLFEPLPGEADAPAIAATILDPQISEDPVVTALIDENAALDDHEVMSAPAVDEPDPPRARRKPLPDSLRPDLPLVTAAELDALTFDEKIVLFA